MTLQDLQNQVWRRMPLAKVLVGRQAVCDMVQMAVETWPAEMLRHAQGENERSVVAKTLEQSVKRLYDACSFGDDGAKYGMVWTIIIESIISALVSLLIRWWYESSENRCRLILWKRELTR